jgi:hypothetical protein
MTCSFVAMFSLAGIGGGWMSSRSLAELRKERVKRARSLEDGEYGGKSNDSLYHED